MNDARERSAQPAAASKTNPNDASASLLGDTLRRVAARRRKNPSADEIARRRGKGHYSHLSAWENELVSTQTAQGKPEGPIAPLRIGGGPCPYDVEEFGVAPPTDPPRDRSDLAHIYAFVVAMNVKYETEKSATIMDETTFCRFCTTCTRKRAILAIGSSPTRNDLAKMCYSSPGRLLL